MSRPRNILLLITDQHRADTLGCYGNAVCETPNLDRLAEEGVRFSNAFTPTSICTPARASLLTGVMPHHHRLLANFERNVGYLTELPDEMVPFSHNLCEQGYNVGSVGKWHIGEERGPEYYGLDGEHYPGWGPPVEHPSYLAYLEEHGLPPFAVRDPIRGTFPNGTPGNMLAGVYDGPAEGLFDCFITEQSIAMLREYAAADRPFFLACQWFGPHLPYLLPEADYFRYDPQTVSVPATMDDALEGKPQVQRNYAAHWAWGTLSAEQQREVIAAYWGYVTLIDREVGRVVAALAETELADDTTVIFTADHGTFGGAHRMEDKGPAMYDDTYRIPLIVRMPGGRVNATEDALVSLVDLTATFLDLAGAPVPPDYDGRSLRPLLQGEPLTQPWRNHVIAEFHGHHFPYPQRMIRTQRYKLVVNPADIDELYDLKNDPLECHNLRFDDAYASIYRDLCQRLYDDLRASEDNFYHWMTSMHPVSPSTSDASLSQYKITSSPT